MMTSKAEWRKPQEYLDELNTIESVYRIAKKYSIDTPCIEILKAKICEAFRNQIEQFILDIEEKNKNCASITENKKIFINRFVISDYNDHVLSYFKAMLKVDSLLNANMSSKIASILVYWLNFSKSTRSEKSSKPF